MLPVSDFNFKKERKEKINFLGQIKPKVLIVFAIFIPVISSIQLVFASSLASDGQKLHRIEGEIKKFESQNLEIKARIAQSSSFATLTQKAQNLGFKDPQKTLSP